MGQVLKAIATIGEIISTIKGLVSLYREARREGWIEDGRNLTQEIKGAKTDEERKELAKRLFDHRANAPL